MCRLQKNINLKNLVNLSSLKRLIVIQEQNFVHHSFFLMASFRSTELPSNAAIIIMKSQLSEEINQAKDSYCKLADND